MSKISRYFIQPGVNFVDFSLDLQPDASLQGQTVGITLCGGNVDSAVFAEVLRG